MYETCVKTGMVAYEREMVPPWISEPTRPPRKYTPLLVVTLLEMPPGPTACEWTTGARARPIRPPKAPLRSCVVCTVTTLVVEQFVTAPRVSPARPPASATGPRTLIEPVEEESVMVPPTSPEATRAPAAPCDSLVTVPEAVQSAIGPKFCATIRLTET